MLSPDKPELHTADILVDSIERPFAERVIDIFSSRRIIEVSPDEDDPQITNLKISGSQEAVDGVNEIVNSLRPVLDVVSNYEANLPLILGKSNVPVVSRTPLNLKPNFALERIIKAIETAVDLPKVRSTS